MALADLQEFIALLALSGELRPIDAEVDPSLEAAAVVDRISKLSGGGPALIFERLAGARFPLAANLFGSPARLRLATGAEPDELRLRVERLLASTSGATSEEKGENLPLCGDYARLAPVTTIGAPLCREVIEEEPDLTAYPFLKGQAGDGGRFITLPLVFTADPASGRANCGMYRLQVAGPRTLIVNFGPGSGGGLHLEAHRKRGMRMPVAVVLGGDPLLTLAATLPLPEAVDEMWYAGFLRGQSVEMTLGDFPLPVPAAAEVVIEGYVEPDESLPEGPFANHTGSYTRIKAAPVLRVTRVTRRLHPVIPATVVGKPPVEDCAMAHWGGRLMLPWLQVDFPEIVDLAFVTEAIFHRATVVSLQSGGRSPQELFPLLRRSRLLKGSRLIVFVGEDIPPADLSTVFWKAINRIGTRNELMIASGEEGEPLSLGFDATRAGKREFHPDAAVARLVEQRWKEYGL